MSSPSRTAWLAGLAACVPQPSVPQSPPEPPLPVVSAGVEGVLYPAVGEVPANALRFELVFREAMALGPHRVSVLDAEGRRLAGALPRVSWDAEVRELSIDPVGLVTGARHTLRVDGLESAEGVPVRPFDHPFVVVPEDRVPPQGARLRVEGAPAPGSTASIRVRFPEPMARSSLGSLTVLAGGHGASGSWSFEDGQRVAVFTPAQPWGDAPVYASIAAGVVDLAGNELTDRPKGPVTPLAPR